MLVVENDAHIVDLLDLYLRREGHRPGLVEAMDGEVEAVAPPGGGTVMVVRLPSVDRPPNQRPSVSDE